MKLSVIGTGGIVREALTAIDYVPQIALTSIFARPHSQDKAERLAKDFSLPVNIYTDYAKLLREDDADFVYIGLVNSAHYEYAKQALLAGKNVIVEKPFTTNYAEAAELAELAQRKNLFLFEAIVPLYTACFDDIKTKLSRLGRIRLVQANFSQYSRRYDSYLQGTVLPAFDPRCGGGALYDINIYNLAFIVALFGRPREVKYEANIGFNGIDTSGVVTLTYDDFMAVAAGAKDSNSPPHFIVQGEQHWLKLNETANDPRTYTTDIKGHKEVYRFADEPEHRMVNEFRAFAQMYDAQNYEEANERLKITLDVMQVAEQARKSAGVVFPADEVAK